MSAAGTKRNCGAVRAVAPATGSGRVLAAWVIDGRGVLEWRSCSDADADEFWAEAVMRERPGGAAGEGLTDEGSVSERVISGRVRVRRRRDEATDAEHLDGADGHARGGGWLRLTTLRGRVVYARTGLLQELGVSGGHADRCGR
ncbi:MAG: hypothetical protein JNM07_11105 [Phycisphaerae bacterium]|nr:hypothetical protein [Phycisphaerae bacterium]